MHELKSKILLYFALLLFTSMATGQEISHNYKPANGYVPNRATAIKIAVAIWEPIYGEEKIAEQAPYKAILSKGIWFVEGTLPKQYQLGGVAIAEIAKEDGKIIRVSHGK